MRSIFVTISVQFTSLLLVDFVERSALGDYGLTFNKIGKFKQTL